MKSPYEYLSKHRSELMGLSIIWVVLFHFSPYVSFAHENIATKLFLMFIKIGYGGVDIFMLLSGMGIFHSLEKNLSSYARNRMIRIVPAWWTYLLLSVIFGDYVLHWRHYSAGEVIGFASFTGYWLGLPNQGNWYVYAIVLFYFLSPVFYGLLTGSNHRKRTGVLLVLAALLTSFGFFQRQKLIVFSRLPIYLMGMGLSCNRSEKPLTKRHWVAMTILLVTGSGLLLVCIREFPQFLWPYGLWWYPFLLIAPSLALMTAAVFERLEGRLMRIKNLLTVFGSASLEILLVSEFFVLNYGWMRIPGLEGNVQILMEMILSFVGGVLFHRCLLPLQNRLRKR